MNFRVVFVVILGLACAKWSAGQTINLMDTLGVVFRNEPKLQFTWDSRNSFINGNGASIFGIKLGAAFGESLDIGLGYNWLYNDVNTAIPINESGKTAQAQLVFRYVAPYFNYSFYHNRKWLVSIPVQLGVGMTRQQYVNEVGQKVKIHQGWVMLYEPAMVLEYQVLPFIGIGGGVGYRLMLKNNRQIDQTFTAPIYKLNFNVKFGVLYQQIQERGWLR